MTLTAPSATDSVRAALADCRPGWTLPQHLYVSREAYDVDCELIFARHWIYVAASPEIPDAGDYLTLQVGKSSVIVIRDDDEEVRAFHNVCRHRGARLLEDPCGSTGNIVCPYHRWTYRPDGELIFAEAPPHEFDKSQFGLRPVHVREIGPLIFVCLAEEPPSDLDDVTAALEPYIARHGLDNLKVAQQSDLVEEGNWKLTMENNRECYHCDGHPELLTCYFQTFGMSDEDLPPRLQEQRDRENAAAERLHSSCDEAGVPYEPTGELVDRVTAFRVQRMPLDGAGESYSPDGSRLVRTLLQGVPFPAMGDLSLHAQPNAWFHFLGDHIVAFSTLPLGPKRTLVRTTWLVNADAEEGRDYDVASLTHTWNMTNGQDAALVERTHRGVESEGYVQGPYSPTESDVEAFVHWYVKRMSEALLDG